MNIFKKIGSIIITICMILITILFLTYFILLAFADDSLFLKIISISLTIGVIIILFGFWIESRNIKKNKV